MADFSKNIKITVDLVTNKAKSSAADFKSAVAGAEGPINKLKAGASSLGGTLKSIPFGVVAGGAAVAGAAVGKFAVESVNKFADVALAAKELGTATGLSTEEASRWIAVADDFGVEAATLQTALFKLGKEAGNNPEKFEKYGVAIARAQDGSVDMNTTLLNTIERLQAIKDPAERAAAGADLLGKGYTKLAPILENTRGELESMLGSVSDAQVITDAEAERARAWTLALDDLQDAVGDVSLELGTALAPVLTDIAEGMKDLVDFGRSVGGVISDIGDALSDLPGAGVISDLLPDPGTSLLDIFSGGSEADKLASQMKDLEEATQGVARAEASALQGLTTSEQAMEDAEDASIALEEAQKDAEVAAKALKSAHDEQAASIQAVIDKHTELAGGFKSYAETAIAVEEANEAVKSAQDDLNAAMEDGESTAADLDAANDSLRDAVIKASEAAVDHAESQAKANGLALTATQRLDAQNSSLLNQAATLTGPARTAILDYIGNLNGIPTEVVSEISALLEQGKIAEAEALLNNTSRARESTVTAVAHTSAAERALAELARERDAMVHTVVSGPGGVRRFATGGMVPTGGMAMVGENGPELVSLPPGSQVHTNQASRGMLAGGGPTINIHVAGSIITERDLEQMIRNALIRTNRRNGNRNLFSVG